MNYQLSFGRWLKRRRTQLGMSQQELVEQVDCSIVMLRKIEADERRPSRQIALLLADHLGVPPDEHDAFVTFARTPRARLSPAAEEEIQESPGAATPWRDLHVARTNLPAELTSLIGREREVEAVRELLLQTRLRLLTLSGPPGIGKTSLALAVAESLIDEFDDGVYLVELAAVDQPEGVLPAIAHRIRSAGSGSTGVGIETLPDSLVNVLRSKKILLVLDNCEHLLDAGPLVVDLLRRCRWLKVLTTSRETLHVRGEHHVSVQPLALPAHDTGSGLKAKLARRSAAVELFVQRAEEGQADFELTDENAADVAAICISLDGLPLAIELAAGRVASLSPAEIRAALQNRLEVLTDGKRDLPPRQRTLRSAIEWSFSLLDSGEQFLFARLGVFVGGFSPAAVEAISPRAVAPGGGNATVEALLAKNLLTISSLSRSVTGLDAEEPRWTMLQTVHEYALEKLEAVGEAATIGERHAHYYLAQAETNAPELGGPEGARWLSWFELEHDNMRAALNWLLAPASRAEAVERVELAIRLCAALWQFWKEHGHIYEGREIFGAVLEQVSYLAGSPQPSLDAALRCSPTLPGLWAMALSGAGIMAVEQGDTEAARSLHEQSLALRRELGDKPGIASSLFNLGTVALHQGNYDLARRYHEESLALARELGNNWKIALSLNSLGIVECDTGNYKEARKFYNESLALGREIDDPWHVGMVLNNMGILAGYLQDYAEARRFLAESLDIHRELEDKAGFASAYLNLGFVARDEGKLAEARSMFLDALRLLWEIGDKRLLAECFEGLAGLAGMAKRGERAARLIGIADALREKTRVPLAPSELLRHARYLKVAQALVAAELWESAHMDGAALELERAVAYALSDTR